MSLPLADVLPLVANPSIDTAAIQDEKVTPLNAAELLYPVIPISTTASIKLDEAVSSSLQLNIATPPLTPDSESASPICDPEVSSAGSNDRCDTSKSDPYSPNLSLELEVLGPAVEAKPAPSSSISETSSPVAQNPGPDPSLPSQVPDISYSVAETKLFNSSLESFMIKAYYGCHLTDPRSFFRKENPTPHLREGCTNRILVYRGCFNPPHIAHLNLLRYVFSRAQTHFNVVAAVIVPLSDDSCSSKFDNPNDKSLLFAFGERKRLWEQDAEFPHWASVLNHKIWSDRIKPNIRDEASKEGFDLKLVTLLGSDHVTCNKWFEHSDEVMVSDTGRPADFVEANVLLKLVNYSPWTKVKISRLENPEVHDLDPKEPSPKKRKSDNVAQMEENEVADLPAIQCCQGDAYSEDLFFIPTDENSIYRKYISSTLIREMMSKNKPNPKEITEELASLVLGPHRNPIASDEVQTRA